MYFSPLRFRVSWVMTLTFFIFSSGSFLWAVARLPHLEAGPCPRFTPWSPGTAKMDRWVQMITGLTLHVLIAADQSTGRDVGAHTEHKHGICSFKTRRPHPQQCWRKEKGIKLYNERKARRQKAKYGCANIWRGAENIVCLFCSEVQFYCCLSGQDFCQDI